MWGAYIYLYGCIHMGSCCCNQIRYLAIFMGAYTSLGGYYPNFTVTTNKASAYSHVQLSFWYSTVLQQKSNGLGMQLQKCNQ